MPDASLATGALLITPYSFVYDLTVLALPIAFLIRLGHFPLDDDLI
jgi:hypothetical protein